MSIGSSNALKRVTKKAAPVYHPYKAKEGRRAATVLTGCTQTGEQGCVIVFVHAQFCSRALEHASEIRRTPSESVCRVLTQVPAVIHVRLGIFKKTFMGKKIRHPCRTGKGVAGRSIYRSRDTSASSRAREVSRIRANT